MSNNPKSTNYSQDTYEAGKSDQTKGEMGTSQSSPGFDKIKNFSTSSNINKDKQNRDSNKFEAHSGFDGLENRMEEFGEGLKERSQYISKQISARVQNNPWTFIGGASIAGLAVGYMLGRRSS